MESQDMEKLIRLKSFANDAKLYLEMCNDPIYREVTTNEERKNLQMAIDALNDYRSSLIKRKFSDE